MKKNVFSCMLISAAFASNSYATISPSDLIKVTGQNNPSCVEFYTYQGEMYCSTKANPSEKIDPNTLSKEKQNIVFDDRYWQAAWGKHTTEITTIEYVPKGDDINHWNELITSQFFPSLQEKISPRDYANLVINNLKESGVNPQVRFFHESPDEVIFEFRILKPDNLQQDELQKITRGKDGFYILHYVIKKPDMGEENREKWLTLMKKSSIK